MGRDEQRLDPVGSLRGDATGDGFGGAVSLSSDGTRLTVGAKGVATFAGAGAGATRVYNRTGSGSAWIAAGMAVYGDVAKGAAGASVYLSKDGDTLAVGALGKDGDGQVRVYEWIDAASGLQSPPPPPPNPPPSPRQCRALSRRRVRHLLFLRYRHRRWRKFGTNSATISTETPRMMDSARRCPSPATACTSRWGVRRQRGTLVARGCIAGHPPLGIKSAPTWARTIPHLGG